MINSLFKAFLFFSVFFRLTTPANSQESFLADEEVEVVKRASHSTAVRFEDKAAFAETEGAEPSPVKILFGMRFSNPKDNLIPGAGTDDSLPNCPAGGNIRQDEIVNDSQEMDLVDLLFYNYEDKEQMARARGWERPTAPYLPGDLYNPHSIKDPQQLFARWIDLQCLPTRVRRVYNREGVAFLEYREGTKAWERE